MNWKKYLPSMLLGTLSGLVFLLLGLAGALMFVSSWNGIFLVWTIFCLAAVFYILWMMRKKRLGLDGESAAEKREEG